MNFAGNEESSEVAQAGAGQQRDRPGSGDVPVTETMTRVNASLSRFWSGRRVALLAPWLGEHTAPIIADLTACGATVDAAVAGSLSQVVPDVGAVWNWSDRGGTTAPFAFERWLRRPDDALSHWLDEIDPDGDLILVGNQYVDVSHVCGRPVHGWRRPDWAQWEDKTLVEKLLRESSVPSPTHVVGSIHSPGLQRTAATLNRGNGLIVALDSSRGVWGNTSGLRWVPHEDALPTVLEELREKTEQVRIADFVEGVPCSAIGIVLRGGVAVFDPFEVATLRNATRGTLVDCGMSNHWRPDPGAVEEIRSCARRVGAQLALSVGFRGMFSLDGVAGDRGFVATEVNPRRSGGLGIAEAHPEFQEKLFCRAVQEGLPGLFDVDHRDLEDEIRAMVRLRPFQEVIVPGEIDLPEVRSAAEARRPVRVVAPKGGADESDTRSTGRAWIQGIEFSYDQSYGVTRLFAADPVSSDGLLAPFVAELTRSCDASGDVYLVGWESASV